MQGIEYFTDTVYGDCSYRYDYLQNCNRLYRYLCRYDIFNCCLKFFGEFLLVGLVTYISYVAILVLDIICLSRVSKAGTDLKMGNQDPAGLGRKLSKLMRSSKILFILCAVVLGAAVLIYGIIAVIKGTSPYTLIAVGAVFFTEVLVMLVGIIEYKAASVAKKNFT